METCTFCKKDVAPDQKYSSEHDVCMVENRRRSVIGLCVCCGKKPTETYSDIVCVKCGPDGEYLDYPGPR